MKTITIALALAAGMSSAAQALTIPSGTPVIVETLNEVSSKEANVGDKVPMSVVQDVMVDGDVAIHAGSPASGTITDVQKNGHLGKSGKLTISVDSVTAHGQTIALHSDNAVKGSGGTGLTVATTALVSPLGLLIHGHSAKVPAHTRFTALTLYATPLR